MDGFGQLPQVGVLAVAKNGDRAPMVARGMHHAYQRFHKNPFALHAGGQAAQIGIHVEVGRCGLRRGRFLCDGGLGRGGVGGRRLGRRLVEVGLQGGELVVPRSHGSFGRLPVVKSESQTLFVASYAHDAVQVIHQRVEGARVGFRDAKEHQERRHVAPRQPLPQDIDLFQRQGNIVQADDVVCLVENQEIVFLNLEMLQLLDKALGAVAEHFFGEFLLHGEYPQLLLVECSADAQSREGFQALQVKLGIARYDVETAATIPECGVQAIGHQCNACGCVFGHQNIQATRNHVTREVGQAPDTETHVGQERGGGGIGHKGGAEGSS